MATATRSVKVKFDGTAVGLERAAKRGERAMSSFRRQAKRSIASLDVGGGIVDALGALPSQLKGIAIVTGVAFGAAFAPAAASAIISGILLGVGGGVLVAGIVGAARSPKVQNAWKKFATQAGKTFDKFSAPFIKPMIRAADTFRAALKRMEPTLVAIGRTIAPIVDKLTPAFAGLAEKSLPGILAAAQASVPLFDLLAKHAPMLGDAISGFFTKIAEGSPSAQAFFDKFLGWVEGLLPKLGGFITWLSDLGVKMDAFSKGPEVAGLKAALIDLKDNVLAGVSGGFDKVKESIEKNSATWKQLGKDITTALGEAGPAVKYFVESTSASLAFLIEVYAALYRAIRAVVVVIKELASGSNRLPGNLSDEDTHVEFGKIDRRAKGGPALPFHSYMVGDGGEPEILTMGSRGGHITPLSKVGAAAPPIYVTIPIEIGAEVTRVVRHEIREDKRGTRRAVTAMAGAR